MTLFRWQVIWGDALHLVHGVSVALELALLVDLVCFRLKNGFSSGLYSSEFCGMKDNRRKLHI